MAYLDAYEKYLGQLKDDIANAKNLQKYLVFGYTSNLDVIFKWDIHRFNRILDKFLLEEPAWESEDAIHSMEDFARITSEFLIKGIGGSVEVADIGVCEYLEKAFELEYGLGGNGAQGAAALGTLGIPVVVQMTDYSPEVCKKLEHGDIRIVDEAGQLVPMKGHTRKEPPLYHMILQFTKGDKLKIRGKEYNIPISNRLILFCDSVHKAVPIPAHFLGYLERHPCDISAYLIAGFDAVVDKQIMQERLDILCPHYERLKKANPDFILYFEGADYINLDVKELLYRSISRYADILGMNEEELGIQLGRFGKDLDKGSLPSVLDGLRLLLQRFPVRGIVLHTKDYAMYFGARLPGVDIEKGLTIGNLMSATRARLGRYGTIEMCTESLKMDLSPTGLRFFEELAQMQVDEYICLVPSRYLEKPKYTIGLGDTFVAGVHTSFLK
ncbi:ADP-dependent glucokinase/phosphofructokinase [Diplocloster modestus]|uniref:ADP-dependent glucokinase/phosphofructokinase n=1 Tax=Diplocloster modestus TaxID=2850322 RepID=A0ABS6K725_9FIRM|nr:ADP-dependent glucokinase/phosphofructokinase [Diplocloster modestus]MBU9726351.1 ADP-dependent glucokinase/phosphofructokinase [Diplocloster modestus]